MSSDLQSALQAVQLNNYVSFSVITAVVYDYLLTFSREMDYIWRRPWSSVSTLFVLVRYLGVSSAILNSLYGGTFLIVPLKVSIAVYFLLVWGFEIFYNAADLVMVLRVYAIWSRSRWILCFLLCIYIPQVVISCVAAGIAYNPNTTLSVTVIHLLDFSFCNALVTGIQPQLPIAVEILRLSLAAILLILAITQTVGQSIVMYKATKVWRSNQYLQLFVRDGAFYFFMNVLFNVILVVSNAVTINGTVLLFLGVVPYVTICPMMPRFIIGVRELYDRDLHRRWQGDDTGFGVLSELATGQNTTMSAIAFTDSPLEQDEIIEWDTNESEGIVLGSDTHRV